MHNPNKVLLGTTKSSFKEVTSEAGSPATFSAGLIVRATGSGLSLSSGSLKGVSLGMSLSDNEQTAVVRKGADVPVRLKDEGVAAFRKVGDITFTAKQKGTAGNSLTIALVDTATGDTAVASVAGNAISISIDAGTTEAQTIADAVLAAPAVSALITAVVDPGDEAATQSAAAAQALQTGAESYTYVVIGQKVIVDSAGLAASTGTTTSAVYVSGPLDAVTYKDEPVSKCALVDMPGGLI